MLFKVKQHANFIQSGNFQVLFCKIIKLLKEITKTKKICIINLCSEKWNNNTNIPKRISITIM